MVTAPASRLRTGRLLPLAITLATAAGVLLLQPLAHERLTQLALAGLVGGLAVLWISRHVTAAVCALIVWLPVQQTVLAFAYSHGVPAAVTRNAGFFKEAVAAGLLAAAFASDRRRARRLTLADYGGLGLVAVATFYLLLPVAFPGVLGGQDWYVRFVAWRLNVLFVVVFLAARRLEWTAADLRRVERAVLAGGALLAVGGVWELLSSSTYDHFLTDTVQQPRFLQDVLDTDHDQSSVLVRGGDNGDGYLRVGGFLINPLSLGFALVLPLALGVRRFSRGGSSAVTLVTVGCAAALVATLTRSAILAGLVALLVTSAGAVRARYPGAPRLLLATVAAGLCLLPLVPGTALGSRISGGFSGTEHSATAHSSRSSAALEESLHTPLGRGLGSNPVTGLRYDTSNNVTAEDAYLQVSLELGWAGFIAFLVLVVGVLLEAGRLRREPGITALAAGLGLSVGALFLHVWLDFITALVFWVYAGIATATGAEPREEEEGFLPAHAVATR